MANPYFHAVSSAKRFGGKAEDYLDIHRWFDASKEMHGDFRHRALRHHAQGIFECERTFGVTITNSSGRKVPTRWIGEQHVTEDLGWIPALTDWLSSIEAKQWMNRTPKLTRQLEHEAQTDEIVAGIMRAEMSKHGE